MKHLFATLSVAAVVMATIILPSQSVPLAQSQSCTPVGTANLAGHWKFDEASGTTTADSSGMGHTGTLQNGPLWVTPGAPALSVNPAALSFDGTNDYVSVANSSTLRFGTGSFTVSLWARPATGEGDRAVLGNFDDNGATDRGWGLYLYDTNRVNFFGYGAQGINDTSHAAPTILNGGWHHVAGVYSRSGSQLTIRAYVDGTLVGTNTATVGDIGSPNPLLFGDYESQPNYQGRLDEIQVYNRALTGTEVSSLAVGCMNMSSSSSSSSMTSSSSSMSSVPPNLQTCNGMTPTVYVWNGNVVGGRDNGKRFNGNLYGTDGNDVILGTNGRDRIHGRDGNDTICALGGDDRADGDDGNDWIDGGLGSDDLDGDDGNDTIFGRAGDDRIDGDDGNDVMCGAQGADRMDGGDENDRIDGGTDSDRIDGDHGTDTCRNGQDVKKCEQVSNVALPECGANQ